MDSNDERSKVAVELAFPTDSWGDVPEEVELAFPTDSLVAEVMQVGATGLFLAGESVQTWESSLA